MQQQQLFNLTDDELQILARKVADCFLYIADLDKQIAEAKEAVKATPEVARVKVLVDLRKGTREALQRHQEELGSAAT